MRHRRCRDVATLDRTFSTYAPSVVFHAAAYKHVPLMEGENAWQAVRNNVIGSRCVAEASQRHGVEKMVLCRRTRRSIRPMSWAPRNGSRRVLRGLQRKEAPAS